MSASDGSSVYLDNLAVSILYEIWPDLQGRRLRKDYYSNLIAYLNRELSILVRSSQPIKHSDVQNVFGRLDLLKQNVDKPLSSICDILKVELGQTRGYENVRVIEFLTKAWLTVELDVSNSTILTRPKALDGNEGPPLQSLIKERFQDLIPHQTATIPLSKGTMSCLKMRYLIDKYGWAVSWTSDLTEHLTVNSRSKIVRIYEHKVCLLHHFEFGYGCPIPQEAIKEALDTLNLLFPSDDAPTQHYLEEEGRPFYLLGSCNREDYHDLAHYRYWHKGLSQLLGVIEEEPPGLKQFMLDREHRNFREVTTFWLAVVIIVFLTLGFGIISTVFAAKTYQVALMQYNLELAQACSAPGASASLSRYCVWFEDLPTAE
ncbi:hypothetical protein GGR55DRAFT_72876 [Xylaria sp. FL0064]|nr:hypothetical protein GGR55DRAFT_72876 [Xylaria sp. FL0064]